MLGGSDGQLRVDPSKIEPDSSSILRTWYKEKKKAREMKEACWRTYSKRRRNESDDSWEPEKASRGGSLPSSQPCDRVGAESGSDQEEEEVPLRPRKLTDAFISSTTNISRSCLRSACWGACRASQDGGRAPCWAIHALTRATASGSALPQVWVHCNPNPKQRLQRLLSML